MEYNIHNKENSEAIQVYLVNKSDLDNNHHKKLLEELKFQGNFKEAAFLPESKMLFIGLTLKPVTANFDDYFQVNPMQLGAAAYKALSKYILKDIQIDFLSEEIGSKQESRQTFLSDFMLGFFQASYKFDKYLKAEEEAKKELNIYLSKPLSELATANLIQENKILNASLNFTRWIVDDTPENINPETMPKLIRAELEHKPNISIKEINYQQLQELGMEGVLFVGRASPYKPVLVHTILKPKGEVKKRVALVGKGITFDSGGLNIKPGEHMKTMKTDMAGSATMFGVIKTLAELGLQNTEVHWISAFAENVIDGSAYKPDDILTTYSGQTVEVFNTDAEGRLTLADALAYATMQNPDYIIDAATLTGACPFALSEYFTGLMGNDKTLISDLEATFVSNGEPTIVVPMPEVLREYVKGDISDLMNTSKGQIRSGHVTAGLFLSHFVDQNLFRNPKLNLREPKAYKWAHMDIAGSAHNEGRNNVGAKGATGQSVKSLVKFIQKQDN